MNFKVLDSTYMQPTFFADQHAFRKWLSKNYIKESELIVGYYKVKSGKASMTWSESVDQALCFGWIDGVRKSIDEESYQIRFTKRNVNSIWSAVNIKKIANLKELGLMVPAGLEIFEKRKEPKSRIYSYENEPIQLAKELEQEFRRHKKAWAYFDQLAPSYKKLSVHWVMDAKQEKTVKKRFDILVADSVLEKNRWKTN